MLPLMKENCSFSKFLYLFNQILIIFVHIDHMNSIPDIHIISNRPILFFQLLSTHKKNTLDRLCLSIDRLHQSI
jgi:hypothetical protein